MGYVELCESQAFLLKSSEKFGVSRFVIGLLVHKVNKGYKQ